MARYRNALPRQTGELFLIDGGLETTLIFHEGQDLPEFAAFDLLRTKEGQDKLQEYYRRYAAIAQAYGTGFILESPTWRANRDWGRKIDYSSEALEDMNQRAIRMMEDVRSEFENGRGKMVISGNIGPRDDGYNPASKMTADEAQRYHSEQINTFRDSKADMINCAHPTQFEQALEDGAAWVSRIQGIRANASCKSHAELDEAIELDDGNPIELGEQHRQLKGKMQRLNVFGGCCGTDHRHVEAICKAFTPQLIS